MSYFPNRTPQIESALLTRQTNLNAGEEWFSSSELNDYGTMMVTAYSDAQLDIFVQFSADNVNWDSSLPLNFIKGRIPVPQTITKGYRYVRLRIVNVDTVASTYIRVNAYYGDNLDKLTAVGGGTLAQNYGAQVTRPSNFSIEVAQDLRQGYNSVTKFGRRPSVTSSTRRTIWNGAGDYNGFNPDTASTLNLVSTVATDTGVLLSSGTSTSGSSAHLVDSSATFITDGVAVGDLVINDTSATHGIVKSVVSETELEIWDNIFQQTWNGVTYRVATANNTGAAVVKISYLIDGDWEQPKDEYIIMNGTSNVATTGSYIRCHRASVILSGTSFPPADGNITITHASSGNILAFIDGVEGGTTQATFTIPKNKEGILTRFLAMISRSGAQSGSATIRLTFRPVGQAWVTKNIFDITTASPVNYQYSSPIKFPEMCDVRIEIDNGSATLQASAEMEGMVVDSI